MNHRIGVHLNAQSIHVALCVNLKVTHIHTASHKATDVETLCDALTSAIEACVRETDVVLPPVGIALEAIVTPGSGEIVECDVMPWLVGFSLQALMAERLGVATVSDAEIHCAAWAEQLKRPDDEKTEPALCFAPTLYGGAVLIIHGQVKREEDGYGMDFPNLVLDKDGPLGPGGDRGCAEMYVLAPGLRRLAAEHGLPLTTDDPIHEVCQLATDGDDKAAAILDEACIPVGRMIAALRRVLGLEMMDPFWVLYADAHLQTTAFMTPIATAAGVYLSQHSGRFDGHACVVGAAYLHD